MMGVKMKTKLKYLCKVLGKGNFGAMEKEEDGDYPFYVSGEKVYRLNSYSFKAPFLALSSGGSFYVHYVDEDAALSTHVIAISGNKINQKFLYFALRGMQDIVNDLFFYGIGIKNLNLSDLLNVKIKQINLDEQVKIADYLERETSKIDLLIDKKSKFVELLKEKRQALIAQVVTKGLDPNVKMKDSGVEWLGEIPEHWDFYQVKKIAKIESGYPFNSALFSSEGFPKDRVIRIRDLSGDEDMIFSKEICPKNSHIINGDILIGMDGDFTIHSWDRGEGKLNQRVCAIRCGDIFVQKFLLYSLATPIKITNDLMYSTTVKHLSQNDIYKIKITAPGLDEIINIVLFIDSETARIDKIIKNIERSICLLKERRAALITEAVAGKVDCL